MALLATAVSQFLQIARPELLAHPGHGSIPADEPLHYVAEPLHAVWWVLLLAAGIAAGVWYQTRRRRTRIPEKNPVKSRDGHHESF